MQNPTAFRYDVSLAWPGNFQIEAQLKIPKVFDPRLKVCSLGPCVKKHLENFLKKYGLGLDD